MDKEIKGILVYYIDVGQLPPYKAEAFIERVKDRCNKDNFLTRLKEQGYESFWIPVRPNSQTRVEMVPCVEGCIPVINHYHCPEDEDDVEIDECDCGLCLQCENKAQKVSDK